MVVRAGFYFPHESITVNIASCVLQIAERESPALGGLDMPRQLDFYQLRLGVLVW